MHEMQSILTDVRGVCLSVCLSRGSSRLHCAKVAELIKILFGVNTPGACGALCQTRVLIPPQKVEGPSFKFWDPPHISGTTEATNLRFSMHIERWGRNEKYATVGHMIRVWVT